MLQLATKVMAAFLVYHTHPYIAYQIKYHLTGRKCEVCPFFRHFWWLCQPLKCVPTSFLNCISTFPFIVAHVCIVQCTRNIFVHIWIHICNNARPSNLHVFLIEKYFLPHFIGAYIHAGYVASMCIHMSLVSSLHFTRSLNGRECDWRREIFLKFLKISWIFARHSSLFVLMALVQNDILELALRPPIMSTLLLLDLKYTVKFLWILLIFK